MARPPTTMSARADIASRVIVSESECIATRTAAAAKRMTSRNDRRRARASCDSAVALRAEAPLSESNPRALSHRTAGDGKTAAWPLERGAPPRAPLSPISAQRGRARSERGSGARFPGDFATTGTSLPTPSSLRSWGARLSQRRYSGVRRASRTVRAPAAETSSVAYGGLDQSAEDPRAADIIGDPNDSTCSHDCFRLACRRRTIARGECLAGRRLGMMGRIMRLRTAVRATALLTAAALTGGHPSAAGDSVFLSILPPGENGNSAGGVGVPVPGIPVHRYPPHFVDQLALYTALSYAPRGLRTAPCAPAAMAGDHVSASDLACDYYKRAGLEPDTVTSRETLATPWGGAAEIRRDGWGVPFIRAGTRRDALYGFGYAAAEDRLWFYDVLRHVGRGRLSEFLGPAPKLYEFDASLAVSAGCDEDELTEMTASMP